MSKFKQIASTSKFEDTQTGNNRMCLADGCPLVGTMSSDTSGDHKKWYCRHHFGKDFALDGSITLKINQNLYLYELLDICISPEKHFRGDKFTSSFALAYQHISEKLSEHGLGELADKNLLKTSRAIYEKISERMPT
jgi:hypothetical protein